MKLTFFRKTLFIALLTYVPLQSMAWGLLGHRVVGEIAESYLNRRASREVRNILGNETMAMAANWGDFIKSESSYDYVNNWHFINLPAGKSQDDLQSYLLQDTVTDVYTRVKFLTAELKNKSLPADKKVMYLKLLIHFVGDIHQPMHTAHFEDLGGGKVQISWFGQPSNLHRVWDSDLVGYQSLSYTEYAKAINFIDKPKLFELQNESLDKWIKDSYLISENIYAHVKPGDKLSYRYVYDYLAIADQQLLKGGVHLAALLNDIFG
jgi:hypothetical protein